MVGDKIAEGVSVWNGGELLPPRPTGAMNRSYPDYDIDNDSNKRQYNRTGKYTGMFRNGRNIPKSERGGHDLNNIDS